MILNKVNNSCIVNNVPHYVVHVLDQPMTNVLLAFKVLHFSDHSVLKILNYKSKSEIQI